MVIADGHQRVGLARRLSGQNPKPILHAYVFREADGWTPADVRAHAALKNMRELSGTVVDMAKVMRERPDLIDDSLPLSDGEMREAVMLARLSDEAFGAAVAGRLPPTFAALIGEHVTNPARHAGLLHEIAAADLANAAQARFFLAQLLELPTTTEVQHTLFGEEAITRTLMVERSRVLDAALRGLKSDKRIFGLLEREARRIAEGGNVLDREGNAARAQDAGHLGELIEKLTTTRGAVATPLNDAAIAVSRGLAPAQASRAFVRRIGDILDKEGINGLLRAEPSVTAEVAHSRIDEPGGPEAKAQVEALEQNADQGVMFAIGKGRRPSIEQEKLLTAAAWRDTVQTFDLLAEDGMVRGRKFFEDEALSVFDSMSVNVKATADAARQGDEAAAQVALRAAITDATRLDEIAPENLKSRANLYTQYVRLAVRRHPGRNVLFALGGGGGEVLDFPNRGKLGRMQVLQNQIGDLYGKIDKAHEEISSIEEKEVRSPKNDARVSELIETIDNLNERLSPLSDELKQLEDEQHAARRASGLFDRLAEARDKERRLRHERLDLEDDIGKLETASSEEPDNFQKRRSMQVARDRLTLSPLPKRKRARPLKPSAPI